MRFSAVRSGLRDLGAQVGWWVGVVGWMFASTTCGVCVYVSRVRACVCVCVCVFVCL